MNKKILLKVGAIPLIALFMNLSYIAAEIVFLEWIAITGTRGWDIVKVVSSNKDTGSNHIMYVAKFDTNGMLIWNKNIQYNSSYYNSLMVRRINVSTKHL